MVGKGWLFALAIVTLISFVPPNRVHRIRKLRKLTCIFALVSFITACGWVSFWLKLVRFLWASVYNRRDVLLDCKRIEQWCSNQLPLDPGGEVTK